MTDNPLPVTSGLLFDDLEIVCIFDGYEPQLAQIVIDTINEQQETIITVMFNFICDDARRQANWN